MNAEDNDVWLVDLHPTMEPTYSVVELPKPGKDHHHKRLKRPTHVAHQVQEILLVQFNTVLRDEYMYDIWNFEVISK